MRYPEFRFSRRYQEAATLPGASRPSTPLAQGRQSCRAETVPVYPHLQGGHRAAAGPASPPQTRSREPTTGIAIVNDENGQVLFAAELAHRSQQTKKTLDDRPTVRRGRRPRYITYHKRRLMNRRR